MKKNIITSILALVISVSIQAQAEKKTKQEIEVEKNNAALELRWENEAKASTEKREKAWKEEELRVFSRQNELKSKEIAKENAMYAEIKAQHIKDSIYKAEQDTLSEIEYAKKEDEEKNTEIRVAKYIKSASGIQNFATFRKAVNEGYISAVSLEKTIRSTQHLTLVGKVQYITPAQKNAFKKQSIILKKNKTIIDEFTEYEVGNRSLHEIFYTKLIKPEKDKLDYIREISYLVNK
ncbi:hypothetical protein LIS90_13150 [Flavobacterium psychrophilum]|uniref:hypothetical protein n=1 Tax=Flavobacterium psychrophilum TaxID=96345 RepID=UPI001D0802CC|nr:hypothetical protein [Flavobacterium psychrophilum]MCB6232192.1 hypothetical protein [Flavobacterium psychrophilum]